MLRLKPRPTRLGGEKANAEARKALRYAEDWFGDGLRLGFVADWVDVCCWWKAAVNRRTP